MPADQVAEDDYQSFCEALGSTARGRAFLDEFARRNRHADTEIVLAALARLESTARGQSDVSPDADRIRQDLRALLDTLRSARPQTENSPTAIKAATLAALIDFVQARIEALVTMPARDGETLSEVPALEQPELPMPHPAAAGSPVMALVQASARIEQPAEASFAPSFTPPQAKRKTATIIPIVEFDYRAHQAGRPLPVRYTPEESWTALAPPFVAMPAMMPTMPEVEAPEAPPQAGQVQIDAKPEVETYELWLDPPPVTRAELAMLLTPASDAVATTAIEAAPDFAAPQAMTANTAITEMAIADIGATDMAAADAMAPEPSAEAAISTIETLMQQMEQAAAPAATVKGHAETPDPLAPLMALSEEERIALFT